jgi:hypothetical protein
VFALLYDNQKHKNDIIIFSDAEELGLNGAAFVPSINGQRILA